MVGPSSSRFVMVDGFRIHVRTFEPRNRRGTLLCVHGGPGATHEYLLPLADLTRSGYRVVFYDALGCGRSDLPSDTRLFTFEHDLQVLEAVRRSIQPEPIHLMGSSYGGMLVLGYATRRSENLLSLNATGGLCDVAFATEEMRRLIRRLPAGVQATLRRFEDLGEYHHPEYERALMTFYRRHVCRRWPWPAELSYSLDHISRPVYEWMNGPNEFTIIGTMKDIDFTDELPRINVPTLLIHGKYDEVTPEVGRRIHAKVPGSRLHIFPKSSHTSFWEERSSYLRRVQQFMTECDRRAGGSTGRLS
jgi:proline iminopeptidase